MMRIFLIQVHDLVIHLEVDEVFWIAHQGKFQQFVRRGAWLVVGILEREKSVHLPPTIYSPVGHSLRVEGARGLVVCGV